MTIFEIDEAIRNLVDPATGDIASIEDFEALQMERDKKIENTACLFKENAATIAAIREEEKNLAERRRSLERVNERLQNLLSYELQGSKFESPRVKVSYRKSKTVEIGEDFVRWAQLNNEDDLLIWSEPKPNKAAIKDAIEDGREVFDVEIVEHSNMSIK